MPGDEHRNDYRRPFLAKGDIHQIHDASMALLENTGIVFHSQAACDAFRQHGFKVDGKTVYFRESAVYAAIEKAPSHFLLQARNARHNVKIGENALAVAPGYGAPYIVDKDGERRKGTLKDYRQFCKLVQSSEQIDVNGYLMVEPSDVPSKTAYLDMMLANMLLCDKPFMSSVASRTAAMDCMQLISMLFGASDSERPQPATMVIISASSPLQFTAEMADSLMVYAEHGQACLISSLIMAASSGPVGLAGVLTLQNAEVLAGITLAQLVRAGAPVVYGSASAPMDMRTGGVAVGAPEAAQVVAATAQMARFYHLPSRSGGGLSDAHIADAQAGVESAVMLYSAALQGINFVLHACGILASYLAMSFEKFVIDEEVVAMVKKAVLPIVVSPETIDTDTIKKVGAGGQFLTQPKTRESCWTAFYMPNLMRRRNYRKWQAMGSKRIDQQAAEDLMRRLDSDAAAAQQPPVAADLKHLVKQLKAKRE